MTTASPPLWKRLLPLAKIAIAAGLIALIIWLVPVTDQMSLPGVTAADDATIAGRILDRDGTTARFETEAGELLTLTLAAERGAEENAIVTIAHADGSIDRPAARNSVRPRLNKGILSVVRNARLDLLLLSVIMIIVGSLLAVYRWTLLLRAADLVTGLFRAVSLTFIGLFFNTVMPGLTGGDLVKAVYIARDHSKKKTEAIITVLLDRVLGITGLALVAGLVIPWKYEAYAAVAPWIYGFLLVLVFLGVVFFSRRVRSAVRLDEILKRLPLQQFILKINQAVFLYRYRKGTVLTSVGLSMVVHLMIITGIAFIGIGIGLDVPMQSYFAIMPIVLIVMALPVSPGGLGTGEAAAIYFWSPLGVSASEAFSLLLVYRMAQIAVSLIGGLFLAFQKERVTSEEMEAFSGDASPPSKSRRDASAP